MSILALVTVMLFLFPKEFWKHFKHAVFYLNRSSKALRQVIYIMVPGPQVKCCFPCFVTSRKHILYFCMHGPWFNMEYFSCPFPRITWSPRDLPSQGCTSSAIVSYLTYWLASETQLPSRCVFMTIKLYLTCCACFVRSSIPHVYANTHYYETHT